MKINKHIEIIRCTDSQLSSMSKISADAVARTLSKHFQTVGISIIDTLSDLEQLIIKRPDVVFVGLKYVQDENQKVWISEYLESHEISHTGSPKKAIALEQNKSFAKQCVLNAGLASAKFAIIKHGQSAQADFSLAFPVFVKPATLGGGNGVDHHSIVYNQEGLQIKLDSLWSEFSADALVEEYLPGREFSVAILKDSSTKNVLAMPIEMKPGQDINGDRILSYALKAGKLETPIIPVRNKALHARLCELAQKVFEVIEARDYGRIDIRLDAFGEPHFLEANLIPGMIKGSGNFPKACLMNENIDHEELLLRIVQLAIDRDQQIRPLMQQSTAKPLPLY